MLTVDIKHTRATNANCIKEIFHYILFFVDFEFFCLQDKSLVYVQAKEKTKML